MARPKNLEKSIRITITATPKLGQYLNELAKEQGYGANRAEVAKNLIWRMIEELIHKGVINRRKLS